MLPKFSIASEIFLKNFINVGYFLFLSPFRIKQNTFTNLYFIEKSTLHQVVSIVRIFALFVHLLYSLITKRFAPNINVTLRSIHICVGVGGYVAGILYLTLMNTPSTSKKLLQLINLLSKENAMKLPFTNIRYACSDLEASKNKTTLRHRRMRIHLEFFIHYFILIFVYNLFVFLEVFKPGVMPVMVHTWKLLSKLVSISVTDYSNMTRWKKFVSVCLLTPQMDSEVLLAAAIALLFFLTKALSHAASQFLNRATKVSKNYIPDKEIIETYKEIRQIFLLASRIFSLLTFCTFFILMMDICLMVIWMFSNKESGMTILTITFLLYFGCTLKQASSAMLKIKSMRKCFDVQKPDKNVYFRKLIMMHEINSDSCGFQVCNVYTVTYGFFAFAVVLIVSNATIVLQSQSR